MIDERMNLAQCADGVLQTQAGEQQVKDEELRRRALAGFAEHFIQRAGLEDVGGRRQLLHDAPQPITNERVIVGDQNSLLLHRFMLLAP